MVEDNKIDKYISKSFYNLILKLFILKKISKEKSVYPYDLIKKVSKLKMLSLIKDKKDLKNDIYNTIAALNKSGYIDFKEVKESGRTKKYYYITPLGKKTLRATKKTFLNTVKKIGELLG